MIVTFLIGNGFDLSLGMKTSYANVYDSYIQGSSFSEKLHVQSFKYELQRSKLTNQYKNWSDFEIGMANYAKEFDSEDKFVDCIRDFKSCMVKHLEKEEEAILNKIRSVTNYKDCFGKEMSRSLNNFYKGQSKNVVYKMENMLDHKERIIYKFIIFNYTSVLDVILDYIKSYPSYMGCIDIVHIHGNLKEDVVLGIDNEEQLSNTHFTLSKKGKRAFVKPLFNQMYDSLRVSQAKEMIEKSDIICTYGLSLGQSDKTWVDLIATWLKGDKNHQLVHFDYTDEVFYRYNEDQIMDVEDEKREAFLNRILDDSKDIELVEDQVHIPVAFDIFEFQKYIKEDVQ